MRQGLTLSDWDSDTVIISPGLQYTPAYKTLVTRFLEWFNGDDACDKCISQGSLIFFISSILLVRIYTFVLRYQWIKRIFLLVHWSLLQFLSMLFSLVCKLFNWAHHVNIVKIKVIFSDEILLNFNFLFLYCFN